jgi:hypothetical protein
VNIEQAQFKTNFRRGSISGVKNNITYHVSVEHVPHALAASPSSAHAATHAATHTASHSTHAHSHTSHAAAHSSHTAAHACKKRASTEWSVKQNERIEVTTRMIPSSD